jgi:hypothetical protein
LNPDCNQTATGRGLCQPCYRNLIREAREEGRSVDSYVESGRILPREPGREVAR